MLNSFPTLARADLDVTEASAAAEALPAESVPMTFENLVLVPLKATAQGMLQGVIDALPSVINGLIILIFGWLVATVLSKIIGGTLEKIGFDSILEKIGVTRLLSRLGVGGSITQVLAKSIFWIVILFIFRSAAEALGIEDISALIEQIFAFLPKVITAGVILLVGFMVADIVQSAVFTKLDDLGIRYARTVSGMIFGFIVILVLTVALPQLGVETKLLNATVSIIVAGVALAMALSLGLGLKDLARNVIAGVYARDVFSSGTDMQIEGETVTLAGIGPVTAKCRKDDGSFIVIPNSRLILEPVNARDQSNS